MCVCIFSCAVYGSASLPFVFCSQAAGIDGFQFWLTFVEVILPVLRVVLTVLCPPFAFSRGLLPLFSNDPWLQHEVFWCAPCPSGCVVTLCGHFLCC